MTDKLKYVSAAVCALFSFLFGGVDMFLKILIAFAIIDYISGVIAAIVNNKLNSTSGFKGIFKKVCIFLVVAVAHMIGQALDMPSVRSLVCGYYIANEGISILENSAKAGLPIPEKLKEILEQLKNDSK